jgi:replicative DNA helicase Mcm
LDVSTDIIKERGGWKKFTDGFSNDLKKQNLQYNYTILIISTVNENGDLIRSISRTNGNSFSNTQQQKQEQNNENDEYDEYDATENTNQEKIIEKISIPQAIRKNLGKIQVTGTITGIIPLFKMVSKAQLYCDKCRVYSECSFNLIPIANLKSIKERCDVCERVIRNYNIKPLDHKNTVMIELQEINSFDELDRLSVFLFDEDTIGIKVGENVEIIGEIKILENNFKYFPYLYCESIKYINKQNFIQTDSDIEKIKKFNETHKNKSGGTIRALVEMFDRSIVECEVEKEGILYCAANTSEKIGDKSEHLDLWLIGPPGLAKTKLLERGSEVVPGSSKIGGQYATGKSFTAIVEKTADSNTLLRLGSIPRSRGAICGINELTKLSNQDLDKLYDIMEGRRFDFEKFGIKANIHAPTAIIASANPANNDSWINNEKVDFNELPTLAPLKDRFDLIFIFRERDEKGNDEFADKWSEVEAKKEKGELPDYTEFLVKYIQFAKTFEPVLTDEARFMLKEFYKKVNAKGFGSPRVFKTLKKLAKAIARLKLKNVVDEEDAKKAMEFYNIMLEKFKKCVVYSESPKFLAYKKGVEILEQNKNFGATLEELFKIICKDNKQLATYFGYDNEKSLKIQDNHKIRDVKESLLNHSNIKRINNNPITLKWFDNTPPVDNQQQQQKQSDEHDQPDKEKESYQEK